MNINKFGAYDDKWKYCQENSDLILASGAEALKKSDKYNIKADIPTYQGNYLISYSDVPYYVGEAKNISKRIKQQGRENSSTFYKNYVKMQKRKSPNKQLNISEFQVQVIKTNIGRKELEEFCIVNLQCRLNKFQLAKRSAFDGDIREDLWNVIQRYYNELLYQAEKCFLKQKPSNWYEAKVNSGPGIYYVEHKYDGLIYIGESSNILDRYKTHSADTRFSALRRHIGTDILGFNLKTKKELDLNINAKKDKRMYLTQWENKQVDKYLEECLIKTQIINFGRYEFEEYLIKKFKPLLNRKGNE